MANDNGGGRALNGNGNGIGVTRRLVTLCVGVTLAINTPTFIILKEHWARLQHIDEQLVIRTADRYYRKDAEAHVALEMQKFSNVYFRFEQNERNIQQCLDFMDKHRETKHD